MSAPGPLPKVAYDEDDDEPTTEPLRWRRSLLLFVLTALSTTIAGALNFIEAPVPRDAIATALQQGHVLQSAWLLVKHISLGWTYSVPLMAILLCHEFGHFLAAKYHGVPASLPMFIPFPIGPLGTFGAVIFMPARIRQRNALLDIGAAGPLAGVLAALPVTYFGLRMSTMRPIQLKGSWLEEGTSLLFGAIKWLVHGPIPSGHEVVLHPTAMAGWVALLITMLNLIPYGELDGGHVMYAIARTRSARIGRAMLLSLPVLGVLVGLYYGRQALRAGEDPWGVGSGYMLGISWMLYAVLVWAMHRSDGSAHPPTDPSPLSPSRRVIAVITLLLGVALFMPVPLRGVSAPTSSPKRTTPVGQTTLRS